MTADARRREADELDARILRTIEDWRATGRALSDGEFSALALDLFAHQARWNRPYAAFARAAGFDAERPPRDWREIPAVPTLAFRECALAAFPPEDAALVFETSGTTAQRKGLHYFETAALYDAALLAGFDRFMLSDVAAERRLRYFLLLPDRPRSSLGYMLECVARECGEGAEGSYLAADRIDVERFCDDVARAGREGLPVCLAGTAFAFVGLLDALGGRRVSTLPGSRILETGGFKGRSREITRERLYGALSAAFTIPLAAIVAEYGMTELTSQYYDAPGARGAAAVAVAVKVGPPWLRARAIGADGNEVGIGEVGALRHYDLANRGSAIAIQTEDLAERRTDGFVLVGRDPDAALRGCSLDAEDLLEHLIATRG